MMDPPSEPTPDPGSPEYISFADKGIPPPPAPAPVKEGPSCSIALTAPQAKGWKLKIGD